MAAHDLAAGLVIGVEKLACVLRIESASQFRGPTRSQNMTVSRRRAPEAVVPVAPDLARARAASTSGSSGWSEAAASAMAMADGQSPLSQAAAAASSIGCTASAARGAASPTINGSPPPLSMLSRRGRP